MIVIGTRLFGGTDEVPGLFHVSTKFFHIDFLPLCPLTSYLVLKRRSGSFQGVEMPLSGKSVALAYARALATVAALGTGIWFAVAVSDNEDDDYYSTTSSSSNSKAWMIPLGYFLLTLLLACMLMWHKATRRATYERATALTNVLASNLGPRAGHLAQQFVDQKYADETAVMAVPIALAQIDEEDEENYFNQQEQQDEHTEEESTEHDLELKEGTKVNPPKNSSQERMGDNEPNTLPDVV